MNRTTDTTRTLKRTPRRGAVTLEAIIAIPVLLLVSFAAFQFGVLEIVHSAVAHAANVAAREAAKDSSLTAAGLTPVVEEVLAMHSISIGADAGVLLENPGVGSSTAGATCSPPAGAPAPAVGQVRVTVCVDLDQSPFLFGFTLFGFDFVGDRLEVSAITTKES